MPNNHHEATLNKLLLISEKHSITSPLLPFEKRLLQESGSIALLKLAYMAANPQIENHATANRLLNRLSATNFTEDSAELQATIAILRRLVIANQTLVIRELQTSIEQALEIRIGELITENQKLTQQIQILNQEISRLTTFLATLNQAYTDAYDKVMRLSQENNQLKSSKPVSQQEILQRDNAILRQELETLNCLLQDKCELIRNLQQEVSKLKLMRITSNTEATYGSHKKHRNSIFRMQQPTAATTQGQDLLPSNNLSPS